MGVIDHFEAVDDPAFCRRVDPDAARQQFNMSLGLVIVLAIAAAALAFSFHFEPSILEAQVKAPVKLVVEMPQHVEVQQAARPGLKAPGG